MAEDWVVEPGVGFGPVRLGMSMAEVHELLGAPFVTRGDRTIDTGTNWKYNEGWFIGFGATDRVVHIELDRSAGIRAMFEGVNLLGRSGKPAIDVLKRHDEAARVGDHGYTFEAPTLHVGVWKEHEERSQWLTASVNDAAWDDFHEQLRQQPGWPRSGPTDRPALRATPWLVEPGQSVGPIARGMRRAEVVAVLGTPSKAHAGPAGAWLVFDAVTVGFHRADVFDADGLVRTVKVAFPYQDQVPELRWGDLIMAPDDDHEQLAARFEALGHRVVRGPYARVRVDDQVEIEGWYGGGLDSVEVSLEAPLP